MNRQIKDVQKSKNCPSDPLISVTVTFSMGSSNIFINKTVSQENEIRRSSGGSWMERRLEVVVTMGDGLVFSKTWVKNQ
jgi:hypothetical protein